MQAVIICGEREDNLLPINEYTHHSLLRFAGKSIVAHILDSLKSAGFTEATITVGYSSNSIINTIGDNYNGVKINYENTTYNKSTANALLSAHSNDDMLLINANSIFDFDLNKIIDYFKNSKSACTVVTKQVPDFYNHICFFESSDCKIKSIIPYNSIDNINADNAFTGICILSNHIFNKYDFTNNDFIKDLLPTIIENETVTLYKETGYWQKIHDISSFVKCQHDMLDSRENSSKGVNGVYSDSDISFNGVCIKPPVYIGKNVTLQPGVIIGEYSVIDDNAVIERNAEISRSYIGENSIIKTNSRILSSIVCKNAFVNSGSTCYEHSVIGEKAEIGKDAVIHQDVKIWGNKTVKDGSIIKADVQYGIGKSFSLDEECECSFGCNNISPADITELGMAIGTSINKSDIALVGYCGSNSAQTLSNCLISGLLSTGIKVYNINKCSQQQIAFASQNLSAKISCYISSEHSIRIKLMYGSGCPIPKELERKIENSYNCRSYRRLQPKDYNKSYDFSSATEFYKTYLNSLMPYKFTGLNAEIRCADEITAKLADEIIRTKNDIDGEHIIFHISPDVTSCSVYTEKTNYVFHERLVMLAVEIQKQLEPKFKNDGLMLICIICSYLSQNNTTIYDALKNIPEISSIKRYVSASHKSLNMLKKVNCSIQSPDNIVYENKNSKAKIRPLKNDMGIMIIAESSKAAFASSICDEIEEKLRKYENNILN